MNVQALLDQFLKTGREAVGQAGSAIGSQARSGDLQKYAIGGVVGLLLGSKRGRSLGGTALKVGSVAAIGALAWKAYQDYQAQQQAAGRAAPAPVPAPAFEALPAPAQESHSRALLKAMIAAAKSDGHLDARERGLLQDELQRVNADAATRQWVQAEIDRPVDPADVAAAATAPEMAAELYVASLLVVDETSTMERAYLDELARQLRLAPALKADLEAKVRAA